MRLEDFTILVQHIVPEREAETCLTDPLFPCCAFREVGLAIAMEPFFYDKDYPVICEEGRVVMRWPVDRRNAATFTRALRCFYNTSGGVRIKTLPVGS